MAGSAGAESLYRRVGRAVGTAHRYVRFVMHGEYSHRPATLWGAAKLTLIARFQPDRTKPIRLVGFKVAYASVELLPYIFGEIFVDRLYEVDTDKASLRVIDAGANIGLAMLFFKLIAPDCRVTCFEPDPGNCAIIAANVRDNGLRDVTIVCAALTDADGTVTMHANAALTGDTAQSLSRTFRERLADAPRGIRSYEAPGRSLRPFLDEPLDILKLDVEGAEGRVIASLGDRLADVGCVLMEYHYLRAGNSLPDILARLEAAGHEFRLEAPGGLVSREGYTAMLFAHRDAGLRPLPRH